MTDDPPIQSPLVDIVPSTGQHVAALKLNLRYEDAREVLRLGVSIQHALWHSFKHSIVRKTALIDGSVAAMWGVHGTLLGNIGVPWLLTSPQVKKVSPLKFARVYQEEVLHMMGMYQRLENYVDSEYDSAIRLLEIIGFTIEEPVQMRNGMYCKFWMEA